LNRFSPLKNSFGSKYDNVPYMRLNRRFGPVNSQFVHIIALAFNPQR
jgi:hypothetical protein